MSGNLLVASLAQRLIPQECTASEACWLFRRRRHPQPAPSNKIRHQEDKPLTLRSLGADVANKSSLLTYGQDLWGRAFTSPQYWPTPRSFGASQPASHRSHAGSQRLVELATTAVVATAAVFLQVGACGVIFEYIHAATTQQYIYIGYM